MVNQLFFCVLVKFGKFIQRSRVDFMSFYENFVRLSAKEGLSPSAAAEKIGLDKSAVTRWKKTGQMPNSNNIFKIAEYFGVSTKTLMSEGLSVADDDDGLLLSYDEKKLVAAWRKCNYAEKENIAFLLREYGFSYERPQEKESAV